jgi:flagellar motor switch protein FliG
MMAELLGPHRALVMVDVELIPMQGSRPWGTLLDEFSSLPGLPVSRSERPHADEEETLSGVNAVVSKMDVTVYLDERLNDEKVSLAEEMVPRWLSMDDGRGDTLTVERIAFDTSLGRRDLNRLIAILVAFAVLAGLVLAGLLIFPRALSKNMDKLTEEPGGGGMGELAGGQLAGALESEEREERPVQVELVDTASERKAKMEDLVRKTFSFLSPLTDEQMVNLLDSEPPGVIAVLITSFPVERASHLLTLLPQEVQDDVIEKLGSESRMGRDELVDVKVRLQRKLEETILRPQYVDTGGVDRLTRLLERANVSSVKRIFDSLKSRNPDLARAIRKHIFLFEDIAVLDDNAIRLLLSVADVRTIAHALHRAPEDIRQKILSNCSERMADILQEEMDIAVDIPPDRVEEAQTRIIDILKYLESDGRVQLRRREAGMV